MTCGRQLNFLTLRPAMIIGRKRRVIDHTWKEWLWSALQTGALEFGHLAPRRDALTPLHWLTSFRKGRACRGRTAIGRGFITL